MLNKGLTPRSGAFTQLAKINERSEEKPTVKSP